MTSVRPVNRLLGLGIRGIIPSDVVVLALLMLLMLICQRSMRSACGAASICSTHTVSCIEGAASYDSAVSVCKNVSSAHSAWSKMSVRVQDEGGKERGALGCQETPIMPRGKRMCWSIYKFHIRKPVPGLFPLSSTQVSPRLRLSYSLAIHPLWWVDSTLLHADFLWHFQGSRQGDATR